MLVELVEEVTCLTYTVRMKDLLHNVAVEIIPDMEIGGFTARVSDIPAYGEGDTEDGAVLDLKEALHAYVEAFGMGKARALVYF